MQEQNHEKFDQSQKQKGTQRPNLNNKLPNVGDEQYRRNPSYSEGEDTDTENTSFDYQADDERTEVTPSRLANKGEVELDRSGVNNYSSSQRQQNAGPAQNVDSKENQSLSGTGNQNSRTNNQEISKSAQAKDSKPTRQ